MEVENLEIYNESLSLADDIWMAVIKWDPFAKRGLGIQLTNAIDSVGANISEGFGRMSPKDNRRFCSIARGSLYETQTWLQKSRNRNLIDQNSFKKYENRGSNLKVKLWNYIKTIEKRI